MEFMEMMNCKEVAKRTMAKEKPKGIWERLDYKFHLFICSTCRVFVKQMENLDRSLKKRLQQNVEKHYDPSDGHALKEEVLRNFKKINDENE